MTDWAKLKVVDLKAELKRRALPLDGLKAQLVARLQAADAEASETETLGDESAAANDVADEAPADDAKLDEAPAADEPTEAESALPNVEVDKNTKKTEPDVEESGSAEAVTVPVAGLDVVEQQLQPESEETGHRVPEVPRAVTTPQSSHMPQELDTDKRQSTETLPLPAAEEMDVDSAPESQKRKRRSASPPPDEEALERKRVRAEEPEKQDKAPAVHVAEDEDAPMTQPDEVTAPRDAPTGPAQKSAQKHVAQKQLAQKHLTSAGATRTEAPVHQERQVIPARHPATCALYMKHLMRPIRPQELKDHFLKLASVGQEQELGKESIVNFYLDQIRTHAFVVFSTTAIASRVRDQLHNRVWPEERNRKALWVDYVPPEMVSKWIDMEETDRPDSRALRWEVVYSDEPDGSIEARLENGTVTQSSGPPPTQTDRPLPGPPFPFAPHSTVNAIPVGPRGLNAPTGPRSQRPDFGQNARPSPSLSRLVEYTRSHPRISYQVASDDLARRRLRDMHSYYIDDNRRLGRDINRYTFERGDAFVDRGKENFPGIRPFAHRGGRGGRGGFRGRGGRGGRGGFRPRSRSRSRSRSPLPPPRRREPPTYQPRPDARRPSDVGFDNFFPDARARRGSVLDNNDRNDHDSRDRR